MKIVIFAGGVGTRLWPLSRKNTPKQFGSIIGDHSTLQQTVDRLTKHYDPSSIYIATGMRYKSLVQEQLPIIPAKNFIFEPEVRDVGPAIGLASFLLEKNFGTEPMAILWSDHMVKNEEAFYNALHTAEEQVVTGKANFIFIAQKPRFANQNMGWIECGEQVRQENNLPIYAFKKFKYRPKLSEAQDFMKNKQFVWNLGYFVSTPQFIVEQFKTHAPSLAEKLLHIQNSYNTPHYEEVLKKVYPRLEKISFDDAILEKITQENIFVVSDDLGWSDIGAWESLKEALEKNPEDTITKGNVLIEDSADSLVFNYTNQLVVGLDLSEMVVVNTEDVILICKKTSVPKIKKVVENLDGTIHEKLA